MKLMCEAVEEMQVISEDVGGNKALFLEGIFLQGNVKNRNGRLYPTDTLAEEVDRYVREEVENKRSWGELGHPEGPTINPDRVCHLITELRQDGDNFIGKAKIVNTAMGNTLRGLIEDGNVGMSSRGLGSLKNEGGLQIVQSDFRLATAADVVMQPSAPDAYVKGILEGVDWVYDEAINGWKCVEMVHEQKNSLQSASARANLTSEAKTQMFESFINSLL